MNDSGNTTLVTAHESATSREPPVAEQRFLVLGRLGSMGGSTDSIRLYIAAVKKRHAPKVTERKEIRARVKTEEKKMWER